MKQRHVFLWRTVQLATSAIHLTLAATFCSEFNDFKKWRVASKRWHGSPGRIFVFAALRWIASAPWRHQAARMNNLRKKRRRWWAVTVSDAWHLSDSFPYISPGFRCSIFQLKSCTLQFVPLAESEWNKKLFCLFNCTAGSMNSMEAH